METLLRDSGKSDTELKAEVAKVKAEYRALRVRRRVISLIDRANIMKSSRNRGRGRLVIGKAQQLHF